MKSTVYSYLIKMNDFASIHLVNLSTMTRRHVNPPNAFLNGAKRSNPHKGKDHVMGMVWSSYVKRCVCRAKY
jgi:hypothetical protein